MKNLLYSSLAICFLIFSSCKKDFLDRLPLDELVDDTFFKTEEQLQLAVNGCYAYIKAKNTLDMENLGDNTINSSLNDYLRIGGGDYPSDLGGINNEWTSAYDGIRRCNAFLEKYEKAEGREVIKEAMASEVRFIRAYLYSYLTLFFGDVQLIKKPSGSMIRRCMAQGRKNRRWLISFLANYRRRLQNCPTCRPVLILAG